MTAGVPGVRGFAFPSSRAPRESVFSPALATAPPFGAFAAFDVPWATAAGGRDVTGLPDAGFPDAGLPDGGALTVEPGDDVTFRPGTPSRAAVLVFDTAAAAVCFFTAAAGFFADDPAGGLGGGVGAWAQTGSEKPHQRATLRRASGPVRIEFPSTPEDYLRNP